MRFASLRAARSPVPTTQSCQLLCERYVNSLERQADCSLFGQTPDYGEAADDYRRAIRSCASIPEDRRDTVQLDLLYRHTTALRLPSSSVDPKLAERMCWEAEQIEQHLLKVQKVDELPAKVMISRAIARTLTANHSAQKPRSDENTDDDLRGRARQGRAGFHRRSQSRRSHAGQPQPFARPGRARTVDVLLQTPALQSRPLGAGSVRSERLL